jgi:predicted RNase H-like nuclease (RuvC/YqgF family)
MLNVLEEAMSNVLRRKRSEKLGLELKLSVAIEAKETPMKGLGADISKLTAEISILEEAMMELRNEQHRKGP